MLSYVKLQRKYGLAVTCQLTHAAEIAYYNLATIRNLLRVIDPRQLNCVFLISPKMPQILPSDTRFGNTKFYPATDIKFGNIRLSLATSSNFI